VHAREAASAQQGLGLVAVVLDAFRGVWGEGLWDRGLSADNILLIITLNATLEFLIFLC
jgi:hypothetical protein